MLQSPPRRPQEVSDQRSLGPLRLVHCLWRPGALSGPRREAADLVQAAGSRGQEAHVYAEKDAGCASGSSWRRSVAAGR